MHQVDSLPLPGRRFSSGEYPSTIAGRPVWKFDVFVGLGGDALQQTAYVAHADRGHAFRAVFALDGRARIFGTGRPLTWGEAAAETGRDMVEGDILFRA